MAAGLADVLGMGYEEVYEKISKNSLYEIIKRRIEKEEADRVREFITNNKVSGIRLDADTKGFIPTGTSPPML